MEPSKILLCSKGTRQTSPRPGYSYPDYTDPLDLTASMSLTGRTEPVCWADRYTSSGADFTPIGWTQRISLNQWIWQGRFYPVRADLPRSDGTDEFMNRTEPMKWTGQILPRPGQILPLLKHIPLLKFVWLIWRIDFPGFSFATCERRPQTNFVKKPRNLIRNS